MPKVSVIVPVYKAEKYLHRCIDSILSQSFTDWELILVDDSSPDCSGAICDEYAQKDARIQVIHKVNGGVSNARQSGMDIAKGEYVIHADPDDWVEPNMLEELYGKAKEEDADMVISDFIYEYAAGPKYHRQNIESLDSRAVLQQLLLQQLHGSCCNKLVKRVCYNKWGIKFPSNLTLWEDHWVSCLLCSHDIKICYLPKAYYHYDNIINPNSIVRANRSKKIVEDKIKFCKYFDNLLRSDLELYECLAGCKISTKISMYGSMAYESKEIKEIFPETNRIIISNYGKRFDIRNITPFCLSIILRSEYLSLPAKIIYFVVELNILPLLRNIKHFSKKYLIRL